MRIAIIVMVFVAGCVTADAVPPSPSASHPKLIGAAAALGNTGTAVPEAPDVCTLAAQLPDGDLCAKICDPDAMKAQLAAEGEPPGTCLEFNCAMPDSSHVVVGVCLPPN